MVKPTDIGLRNLRRLKVMRSGGSLTEEEFSREWKQVVSLNSLPEELVAAVEKEPLSKSEGLSRDQLEYSAESETGGGCCGCLILIIALSLIARTIDYFSPPEVVPLSPEVSEASEQPLPQRSSSSEELPKDGVDIDLLFPDRPAEEVLLPQQEITEEVDVQPSEAELPVIADQEQPIIVNPAIPRNDAARWIRRKDYPKLALTEQRQGTVVYRLNIRENGRVESCNILVSSGHGDLDDMTCDKVSRRARFRKPSEGYGNDYISSVEWKIEDQDN